MSGDVCIPDLTLYPRELCVTNKEGEGGGEEDRARSKKCFLDKYGSHRQIYDILPRGNTKENKVSCVLYFCPRTFFSKNFQ